MPEFHVMEADHQLWKQAVLAGELELAEINTEPFRLLSLQAARQK